MEMAFTYICSQRAKNNSSLSAFAPACFRFTNGKEHDDEISGEGNSFDYDERINSTRLGRWNAVDFFYSKHLSTSPYVFSNNNPIIYIDPDGQDWFYYTADGDLEAKWHWCEGTTITLRTGVDASGNSILVTLKGHAAVVVIEGSRDEQLGAGSNISGAGAVTADVTVYGPDGQNDVSEYTGYTMTSDAPTRTPISEGIYTVKRRASSGSGSLPKHYQIFENNIDNILTMDCSINQNSPGQLRSNGDGYKGGIFIHRTNNNGYAGGTVSTGCLLLAPTDWTNFDNQLSSLGNKLDNQEGSKEFFLILTRAGASWNPKLNGPIENTLNCGTASNVDSEQIGYNGLQEIKLTQ